MRLYYLTKQGVSSFLFQSEIFFGDFIYSINVNSYLYTEQDEIWALFPSAKFHHIFTPSRPQRGENAPQDTTGIRFYLSEIERIVNARAYTISDALAQIGGFLSFVSVVTFILLLLHSVMLRRSMRQRLTKHSRERRRCCHFIRSICCLTE